MTIYQWIIPLRVIDLVEIGIFAFILYKLYQLMRGTIAVQIFVGIMALYLMQILVNAADMTMLRSLFSLLSDVFVLALIILFQPEIRRLLLLLGQNPLIRRLVTSPAQQHLVDEVAAAVDEMSRSRIGALIVFERSSGLRSYIETGSLIQSRVTKEMLVTLFFAQNPLHDGAVIIRDRRIEAARCILPVSTSIKLSPNLGLRHRSAVGLTEQTDAFVVVVSEESGRISFSEDGDLVQQVGLDRLRDRLSKAFLPQTTAPADIAPAEIEPAVLR